MNISLKDNLYFHLWNLYKHLYIVALNLDVAFLLSVSIFSKPFLEIRVL